MASSTFRRMGEGMFSSFGEPGRRKRFLMVSISARRAVSNLLTGLSGSASSASRAFSAKENGRFHGEESPHPVFGLQKAAMRAKSSAMRCQYTGFLGFLNGRTHHSRCRSCLEILHRR
jgi:hypothetical protein